MDGLENEEEDVDGLDEDGADEDEMSGVEDEDENETSHPQEDDE